MPKAQQALRKETNYYFWNYKTNKQKSHSLSSPDFHSAMPLVQIFGDSIIV